MLRAAKAGDLITWDDVSQHPESDALRLRRSLEARHHTAPAMA
jgi:predicted homoserine dehydrogenase-like protein